MRSITTAFTIVIVVFALANVASAAGPAPAKLLSYDVTRMSLQTPLVRQDAAGTTANYTEVYLVRLRGNFPNHYAQAMELYVGDKKVDEYGQLPGGGLYFVVTTNDELTAMNGGAFAYQWGDAQRKPLGLKFSTDKMGSTAVPEKTAFKRPWGK